VKECPFYLDLNNGNLSRLYLEQERHDGYIRDQCVFSDQIDIWDTMSVNVRYQSRTLMSYTLNTFSPVEGYTVVFYGTRGRLEHTATERAYVSGDGKTPGEIRPENVKITLTKEFSEPKDIAVETGQGGHGGGDPLLLDDLFLNADKHDPLGRKANHVDGLRSVLVGIGAYQSIQANGIPIKLDEIL